jgi:hypothetical protein
MFLQGHISKYMYLELLEMLFPTHLPTYLPARPNFYMAGYQGKTRCQLSWDSSTTKAWEASNGLDIGGCWFTLAS